MSRPESVEERRARLGRNESLFRAVNERMTELNDIFAAVTDGEFVIVCECGDLTCVQQIVLEKAEYTRVRADSELFIVAPGHEDDLVEAVVEDDRSTAYLVVRKHLPPLRAE